MKKIGIYAGCSFNKKWDELSVLGGSEKWVVNIANEFSKRGYKVCVFGNPSERHFSTMNVEYIPFWEYDDEILKNSYDYFIVSRDIECIVPNLNAKKIYFMAHMKNIERIENFPDAEDKFQRVDAIFFLSNYQKNSLCNLYPYLKEKHFVKVFNTYAACISPSTFNMSKENAMVWSSVPERGFDFFYEYVFPLIKKEVPDFKLYVCTYAEDEVVLNQLQQYPEVQLLGKLSQGKLFQWNIRCKLWVNFNNGIFTHWTLRRPKDGFIEYNHETFCNCAIENAMAGNAIVCFNGGGIADTLKGYTGLLGKELFNRENYIPLEFTNQAARLMADKCIQILKDDEYRKSLAKEAYDICKNYTVEKLADIWEKEFNMDKKITFGIINYNNDENAKRWYNLFKNEELYSTFIVDTYHLDNDTQFDDGYDTIYNHNIYFGGALITLHKLARENGSSWMMYLPSDILITDRDAEKLKDIIKNEVINNDSIVCYEPCLSKDSSGFGWGNSVINQNNHWIFNKNTNEMRSVIVNEDYFMLMRMDYANPIFDLCDIESNKYGWGIADAVNNLALCNHKKNIIDDRVEVYSPQGTGYNREGATQERNAFNIKALDYIRSKYSTYTFNCWTLPKTYHKDPSDKDKYVVFTCAKAENNYIIEWINHYIMLGFDKIIIGDNNDDDSLEKILPYYIKSGFVEVFNCHGLSNWQDHFYSTFCSEGNYKWCAYFDVDEFLELGCGYSNIKDYLSHFDCDVLMFNWLLYGPNGKIFKENGNVQDRFIKPIIPSPTFKENSYVKSIVKGNTDKFRDCDFLGGSHVPVNANHNITYCLGGYNTIDYEEFHFLPPRYKAGYLKHYYTKSFNEWQEKVGRGWPQGEAAPKLAKFFQFKEREFPLDEYTNSLFNGDTTPKEELEPWNETFKQYDVIQLTNSSKNIHRFLHAVIPIIAGVSGYTFIITDKHIDDYIFDMINDCALYYGNKLVYCFNDEQIWQTYLKYHTKGETYYIINLY